MNLRTILTALSLSVLVACGDDGDPGGQGAMLPQAGTEVSAETTADLKFLREEEKLARDVYLTLHGVWGLNPHKNIASSEQTHTERVKDTLAALAIPDPVLDDTVGTFVNPTLAKLYEELTAQGKTSEVASLQVGATVEDLDIKDLELRKARVSDPAILSMYEALQCGSRNHLRSFTSNLAQRGESYKAQYISAEAMQNILSTGQESCGK
jgi:hypothetical protein